MYDPLYRSYILSTVFHTPLDQHDDLPAIEVDEMLALHSRVGVLAEERRRKEAKRGR